VHEAGARMAVDKAVALAEQTRQRFAGLVLAHGYLPFNAPVETVSMSDVRGALDVMYVSWVRLVQLALPRLRADRGRIVLIGSTQGLVAPPGNMAYAAAKHANEALYTALRGELWPLGVSVSITVTSGVKTTLMRTLDGKPIPALECPVGGVYNSSNIYTPNTIFKLSVVSNPPLPRTSTTPHVVHAMTSTHPRGRYYNGEAMGVSAWVEMLLASLLPDRFLRDVQVGLLDSPNQAVCA